MFKAVREHFPHPEETTYEGLLLVDDRISDDILLEAYSFGIFPWPQEDLPLLWFSPLQRGVLYFENYHVPRSFQKFSRKTSLRVTMNQAFDQVIGNCQKAYRPDQEGTWITKPIFEAYKSFHKAGYAHSVECWNEDRLVGGMYGVYVGGVFCGESMFFIEDNASKLCLHKLILFLKSRGMIWMDVQMVTPLLEAMGATYISRGQFQMMLNQAKKMERPIVFNSANLSAVK